jgi:glycosyltransferase involved in cell wall biosynthesis
MTRVLFIHSSNEMYGADRMLLAVLNSLVASRPVEVEVWLPDDVTPSPNSLSSHLEAGGYDYTVVRMPVLRRRYMTARGASGLIARAVATFVRMRRLRPDIVFCTTSATLSMAPIARLAGARDVVLHVQEVWSGGEARVMSVLARSATRVLAISAAVQEELRGHARRLSEVVVNAVPEPADPVVDIGARSGPLHYLVASRWNAWKGHRTLLTAWAAAGSPGRLTVLGGMPPVGLGVDVPGLIAELGLSEAGTVTVLGEVDDITPHIDAHDFLVVPSDSPEPFGLVAIEAFARGRPVIGSDAGGLADIVESGENGFLYPIGDADALATVLRARTRDEVAALGATARASYLADYSIERYEQRMRAFWDSLI